MRYAVRPKQISDNVLCQRSAIVIGADAFRSTPGTSFTPCLMRGETRTRSLSLAAQSITIFSMFFKEGIAENTLLLSLRSQMGTMNPKYHGTTSFNVQ